jgi:Mn2+/Fe2+ NRAMP family transporter
MCARIGLTTGSGLADAFKKKHRRATLLLLVGLLFVANTMNIGADLAAIAAGVELLTGVPAGAMLVPIAVAIAASEIFVPYRLFAPYLKALTLVLFSYVAAAILAHPDWFLALRRTLIPHVALTSAYITTLVALLGTTISPYLFFWQTSEEVEELHEQHRRRGTTRDLKRAQLDVDVGMFLANAVFYFIVLTCAATLFPAGIRDVTSPREAAEALRPLAGDRATILFAVGFIGTGLLSIPVLAGSAAYAVAEVFDWREGLSRNVRTAPQFYAVIAIATVIGLGIALTGVGAIRALFATAVINGFVAPVLIWAIIDVSNDSEVVGQHRNGVFSNFLGYAALAFMAAAGATMIISFFFGR